MPNNIPLSVAEHQDLKNLADVYLICYLNGFDEAKEQMKYAGCLVKRFDRNVYQSLKLAQRILRKVRCS